MKSTLLIAITIAALVIGLYLADKEQLGGLRTMPVQIAFVLAIIISAFKYPLLCLGLLIVFVLIRVKTTPIPVPTAPTTPKKAEEVKDTYLDWKKKEKQMDDAQKALEKYVVDDYLAKASQSHIWDEKNYNLYPNALGLSYNIQGIQNDIVGFNKDYSL